jgi:pre-mRNA-splicing factor 38B
MFFFPQFCLLYKLYTLKLTRKQLNGLIKHTDSPYIRGLGFMYIRFTQPPADLFDWYEEFLHDEEEIDVKAGGGNSMTIGQMCRQFLTKLDWFSTLFPRIPVPIQKSIEQKLAEYDRENGIAPMPAQAQQPPPQPPQRAREERKRSRTPERRRYDEDRYSRRSGSREKHSSKSKKYYSRDKSRSRSRDRRESNRHRKYNDYDEGRSSKRY